MLKAFIEPKETPENPRIPSPSNMWKPFNCQSLFLPDRTPWNHLKTTLNKPQKHQRPGGFRAELLGFPKWAEGWRDHRLWAATGGSTIHGAQLKRKNSSGFGFCIFFQVWVFGFLLGFFWLYIFGFWFSCIYGFRFVVCFFSFPGTLVSFG